MSENQLVLLSKAFAVEIINTCYETDYWLDIFHDSRIITDEEHKGLFSKCSKIRKLLIASITTAKQGD